MKRQFLLKILILLILLSSCSTLSDEERVQSYINKAYGLEGEEAAELYLEGLQDIKSPELYYNLAYSYLEAKEYDKAVETASAALLKYPGRLRFMYLRAFAYKAAGKYYSYEKALNTILLFDPGNDEIRDMLLQHYLDTGRKKEAAALAPSVLERHPDSQNAIKALAYVSPFFKAIAAEETAKEPVSEPWDKGFEIFSPIRLLEGDGLLGDVDEYKALIEENRRKEQAATEAETDAEENSDEESAETDEDTADGTEDADDLQSSSEEDNAESSDTEEESDSGL